MKLALQAHGPATFRSGRAAVATRSRERAQGGAAELAREVADELSPEPAAEASGWGAVAQHAAAEAAGWSPARE
jgi:hypothetical protein